MSISTSYSWHVCQLITQDTPNEYTVNAIDAYLYGIDSEGINNTVKFVVNLTVPDSYSSGEFTEYDNLTKEQVAGWITSTLTAEEQQALKDKLSERLRMFYDKNGNLGIVTSAENYVSYGKPPTPWDVT